jgi:hypothetical protein
LSYTYFLKILFDRFTRWDAVFLVAATTCALYANVTGLWVPFTQGALLAFIRPKETTRLRAFLLTAAPVVLFSPWLVAIVLERLSFVGQISASNWWYFGNSLPFLTFLFEPSVFINMDGMAVGTAAVGALLAAAVILVWFVPHWWRHRSMAEGKLTVAAFGALLPLMVCSVAVAPPYNLSSPRYFYQCAIFFWIVMAYAIEKILEHARTRFAKAALMTAIGLYAAINVSSAISLSFHGNWDAAAR